LRSKFTASSKQDCSLAYASFAIPAAARISAAAAVLLLAIIAIWLRLPGILDRPFHLDEAVQAIKTAELMENGRYRYDPTNHHGPTLYYLSAALHKLSGIQSRSGMSAFSVRLAPLIALVALVFAPLLFIRWLTPWGVVIASALTACSPAFVFYGGYFIQETMFVLLLCLAFYFYWQVRPHGELRDRLLWEAGLGAAAGLAISSKETAVIHLGTAALAAFGVHWFYPGRPLLPAKARGPWRWVALILPWPLAILLGMVIIYGFYSSFGQQPDGFSDFLLSYYLYVQRALGEGMGSAHTHPWWFYWRILLWYKIAPGPVWNELPIVIGALIGVTLYLTRQLPGPTRAMALFLTIYTVTTAAVYCILSYKTPWLLLGFFHGFILLCGCTGSLIYKRRWFVQIAAAALLLIVCSWMISLSRKTVGRFNADPRNPYVYAHTGQDVLRLSKRLNDLAAHAPEGYNSVVKIVTTDYWPLPWYLRNFTQVGYWNKPPENADAPFILTDPETAEQLQPAFKEQYTTEFYGLRPGKLLLLYVRKSIWDSYLSSLQSPSP